MDDIRDLLSIPIDLNGHWEEEVEDHLIRQMAMADFLNGKISYADYEEVLFETKIDPIDCFNHWKEGYRLL